MEEDDQPSVPECVDSLRRSSRSDWIAFGVGTLVFLVGFFVYPRTGRATPPAIAASIVLLLSAFVAGLVSGMRAEAGLVPEALLSPSAVRWGARTGLVVFLVGGGFLMLGLYASHLVNGRWSPPRFIAVSPSDLGAGIFVVFLPTVVAGAFGTFMGLGGARGMLRPLTQVPLPSGKRAAPSKTALILAAAVFVLSSLAPSLRIPPDWKGPSSQSDFDYEAPAALGTAAAGQWRIAASRPVPGLSLGSQVAVSSTGRLIAYTNQTGTGFTVFDLRKGRVEHRFGTAPVAGLAWSPADDRIFYVSAADSSCWVLTPATGTTVLLPVRGKLPYGLPRWTSEREVVFMSGSRQVGGLDLESLTTRTSRTYADRGADPDPVAVGSVAETGKCRLTIRPLVQSLASPLEAEAGTWRFDSSPALCVVDKDQNRVFPLLGHGLLPETRILASPDASMITLLNAEGAVTYYLGIASGPPGSSLRVSLPTAPEHPDNSPLAKMMESGRIGAFVCSPLINPLTGKVIGPDPRHVKALAFSGGWRDGGGRLVVAESYLPIQPGDVAGYLHHWKDGEPSLISGAGWENWWCATGASADSPPDPGSTPRPWQKAELFAYPNGVGFDGWRQGYRDASHPPVTDIQSLAKAPPKPGVAIPALFKFLDRGEPEQPKLKQVPSEKPKVDPVRRNDPAVAIESFIAAHHAKVGAGDLEGFVADYAATVDFNDKGVVGADFIRKDQAAYLPKYDQLSESVIGPVRLTPIKQGWQADYTIRSFAVSKRDGKEHDRKVKITLEIGHYRGGVFQILKERAAIEN